jgi:hypothetical protein
MKLHKYSEDQLRKAVIGSASMRQVLLKLGVASYGGNYDVLRKAIYFFKLDTAHFSGQAWNKGKKLAPKYSLHSYLNNEASIQSYKLKNRLLHAGILKHQCSNCGNTSWLNKPIPLELDHINGDNRDNQLKTCVCSVPTAMQ